MITATCPAAVLGGTALDYFVVAIFLLGITVFLLLQGRYFKRMEAAVAEAFRSRELLDAVSDLGEKAAAARPGAVDLAGVERRLDDLNLSALRREEGLGRAEERLQRIEAAVEELAARMEAVAKSGGAPPLGSSGLLDAIEQRLFSRGFTGVSVIGELSGMETGEHRVSLEALKAHVPYKGTVVVRDGRVVEENLLPIYEAFP